MRDSRRERKNLCPKFLSSDCESFPCGDNPGDAGQFLPTSRLRYKTHAALRRNSDLFTKWPVIKTNAVKWRSWIPANSSTGGGEAGGVDECGHQLALPGSHTSLFSLTLALLVTSGQPGLRPGAPQRHSLLPQVTGRMREACTLLENPVSGQGSFFCVWTCSLNFPKLQEPSTLAS